MTILRAALAFGTALLVTADPAAPAMAAGRLPLPLFGLSVVLPDSWDAEIPAPEPIPVGEDDHEFQTEVKAVCKTEACGDSLEVCTIKVYDEVMDTWDFVSNRMLFPTQAKMDETTKGVLDWTSTGARVAKPLAQETLGKQSWYTIEADPAPGFKAVLHARTVMDGRFVWALCRTCAIDDPHRFETARAILASIRVDEPKGPEIPDAALKP